MPVKQLRGSPCTQNHGSGGLQQPRVKARHPVTPRTTYQGQSHVVSSAPATHRCPPFTSCATHAPQMKDTAQCTPALPPAAFILQLRCLRHAAQAGTAPQTCTHHANSGTAPGIRTHTHPEATDTVHKPARTHSRTHSLNHQSQPGGLSWPEQRRLQQRVCSTRRGSMQARPGNSIPRPCGAYRC